MPPSRVLSFSYYRRVVAVLAVCALSLLGLMPARAQAGPGDERPWDQDCWLFCDDPSGGGTGGTGGGGQPRLPPSSYANPLYSKPFPKIRVDRLTPTWFLGSAVAGAVALTKAAQDVIRMRRPQDVTVQPQTPEFDPLEITVTGNEADAEGDPVSPGAGEFVYGNQHDLVLPWYRIPFVHTRTYRSGRRLLGPQGHNWDHSNDLRLTVPDEPTCEGERHFHTGAGSTFVFRPANGSFAGLSIPSWVTAAAGGFTTLVSSAAPDARLYHYVEDGSERFTLVGFASGQTIEFDAQGLAVRRVDHRGYGHEFEWGAPAGEPRLEHVYLVSGDGQRHQRVDYYYDPKSGLLERVQVDVAGKPVYVVSYEYDEHDDLVRVVSPTGAVEEYSYRREGADGPEAPRELQLRSACEQVCESGEEAGVCGGEAFCDEHVADWVARCNATCDNNCGCNASCSSACWDSCEASCDSECLSICDDMKADGVFERQCKHSWENTMLVRGEGDELDTIDSYEDFCAACDDHCRKENIDEYCSTACPGGPRYQPECWAACEAGCGRVPSLDLSTSYQTCEGKSISCQRNCEAAYFGGQNYVPANDGRPIPQCEWRKVSQSCEEQLFSQCRGAAGGACSETCTATCVEREEETWELPDGIPQEQPEPTIELRGCKPACEASCVAECNPDECRKMCDPALAMAECRGTCVDTCMTRARADAGRRTFDPPLYGMGRDLDHLLVEVRSGPLVGGRPPVLLSHEYGDDPEQPSFGRVVRQGWGSQTLRFSYWDLAGEEERENQGEAVERSGADAALVLRRAEFRAFDICPRCEGGGACTEGFDHVARETDLRDYLPTTATVVHDENGHRRTHYYDGRGRLIRTIDHDLDGEQTSYNYNAANQVTGLVRPNGQRTCLGYNENGLPTVAVEFSALDPSDWERYDGHGPIVRKRAYASTFPQQVAVEFDPRDPTRELVRYEYNGNADLISVRNAVGDEMTIVPGAGHGLPEFISGADGTRRDIAYHATGQVAEVALGTGPGRLVSQIFYDQIGRTTGRVSPLQAETEMHWDGALLDHVITRADEVTTRVDYTYEDGLRVAEDLCSGDSACNHPSAPNRVTIETGYDEYLRPAWRKRSAPGNDVAVSCVLRRPDGQIKAAIDPLGARVDREYDAAGRLTRVVAVGQAHAKLETWDHPCRNLAPGPSGVLADYAYDPTGLVSAEVIAGTSRVQSTYARDGFGRAVATQVGDALVQKTFDELGNATAVSTMDLDGTTYAALAYQFDRVGRLSQVREWQADAPGTPQPTEWVTVATADYTRLGDRIVSMTDARGYRRTVTKDDVGRPVRVEHATGDYELMRYLDGGRTVETERSSPAAGGIETEVTTLTAWGAVASRTTPDGGGVTWASTQFDAVGRPAVVTGVSGQTVRYVYDSFGRVKDQISTLSEQSSEHVRYTYDRRGQVTEHRSRAAHGAAWALTSYQFDTLGRTTRIDRPDGLYEALVFAPDNLSAQPNRHERNGHQIVYNLDDHLRVERATATRLADSSVNFSWFEYDPLGRVVEAGRDGVLSELAYDSRGNVVREWHNLMGADPIEMHYGPRGLQDIVSVGGLTGSRTFDALGRVTKAWATVGSAGTFTAGQLIVPTSPDASVSLQYNGLGGPVSASHGMDTYISGGLGGFGFYANTTLATEFGYDALGQLDSLALKGTGWRSHQVIAGWDYGGLDSAAIPADGAPRRADHSFAGAWASSSTFDVDRAGRVVSEGHDGPGVAPRPPSHEVIPDEPTPDPPPWETCGIWGCDNLRFVGSLGFAAPTGGAEPSAAAGPAAGDDYDERVYQLDGRANWLERQASHANLLSVVPGISAGDRYTDFGDVTVHHEVGGAVEAFTHVTPEGAHDHERFEYDAFGLLERAQNGATDRYYTYDAFGRRIAELHGKDGPQTVYGYAGADRVLRIRNGGAVDLTIDGTGLDEHLFTVFDDGQVHYYHRDRRNSVYLVTDAQGQALERYHYTAYGESVVFAPDGTVLDDTAIDNRFGFHGHVFDAPLGLVDMRARFYRPAWGRFLAPDPIGLAGGPNLYAFVEGKTLTLWDPFGFDGQCGWFCRTGSSIGSALGSAGAAIGGAARTAGDFFVRQVVPRAGGALQATIGGLGALAGAGLCTTGVGCLIGGTFAVISADFAAAGATTLMTGGYTPTFAKRAGTAIGGDDFGRDVEEAQMFIVTAGAASYVPRPSSSTRTSSSPRSNPRTSPRSAQTRPQRYAQPAQQQQARHGRTGTSDPAYRNGWRPGRNDADWRGTGRTHRDAINDAFERTGVPRGDFEITKWGRDQHGKSFPAEWRSKSGAEVNVDVGHTRNGPGVPHVGWQTPGKRASGGGQRGHTLVDEVPYNR